MLIHLSLRKLTFGLFILGCVVGTLAAGPSRTVRIKSVVPTFSRSLSGLPGEITRQTLTPSELKAEQPVHFALRLRNFDELRLRIERGEILSVDELEARHLPLPETWQKVAKWAKAQGFTVEAEDRARFLVVARAPVDRVQTALEMKFARVTGTDGAEYTSAISAPAVPADLQEAVAAVFELQPHLRRLPAQAVPQLPGNFVLPQAFAAHYNATGLGLDGTGQTIVILGANRINSDDLKAFWQTCGLATTIAQFTSVDLSTTSTPGENGGEEIMDVEWASAMAPGAKVVLLTNLSIGLAASWITSQVADGKPIGSVSCSYAGPESLMVNSPALRDSESQIYAALAAIGVSIFISAGNDGSTHKIVNGSWPRRGYDPSGIASPFYPASIPYVTGVGGTTVAFARQEGVGAVLPIQEGAWSLSNLWVPDIVGQPAGAGGVSLYFTRPSWQTGPGVPAGNMRCVPDVAALAACNFSPYMQSRGGPVPAAGTSLAAPIWAGFCALINQRRTAVGLPLLGLLNPRVYPLNGTPAFNQMTTGSGSGTDGFSTTATNGLYMVGPNYTLITGLGSPNVGNLVAALLTEPARAPDFTIQPKSLEVNVGQSVTFSASASGFPTPTFQWYFNGNAFSGATSGTLSFTNARLTDAGEYKVVATNSAGTATSNTVTLKVNEPVTAPAITTQPTGATIETGQSVRFSAAASGNPAPTFQWYFNGSVIVGATASSLDIGSARTADAGDYKVVATNSAGTATSNTVKLAVTLPAPPVTPTPTPVPASSGGGGGGAPSLWFASVLFLLGFARMRSR